MMDFILFFAVMLGGFFAMNNINIIQFIIVVLIIKFLWMAYVS